MDDVTVTGAVPGAIPSGPHSRGTDGEQGLKRASLGTRSPSQLSPSACEYHLQ